MNSSGKVPVLNVSAIYEARDLSELKKLAKDLQEIYAKIGFAYLSGHGIPEVLINAVFEQARLFHHLPLAEKLKIRQNKFFRGYMPLFTSTLKVSTLGKAVNANQSAAFIMAHEADPHSDDYQKEINLAGPNQWPDETLLPFFKKTLVHYRERLSILVKELMRLFALGLDEDYYAFDSYFNEPTNYLRLQYYPPQPEVIPEDQYGIAPHTDYGCLTLLAQDSVGGLQVLTQEEQWIDVEPIPGTLILNTGDMLRYLSGNSLISTPHRVINISGRERYSIPFFFEPNMHAHLYPVGSDKQENQGLHYADYVMDRVKGNYSIGAKDHRDLVEVSS